MPTNDVPPPAAPGSGSRRLLRAILLLAPLLALLSGAREARAETLWGRLFGTANCPHCAGPCSHGMHRAGHPQRVAWYAQPSNSHRFWGYYVGGGAPPKKGDPRAVTEGVWGWDYVGGRLLRPRVQLNWWHGRRQQGGPGAYKTDGPHLLPKKE